MNASRLAQLAPLAGLVSVVTFFGAVGLYGFYEYHPSAEQLQGFFDAHSTNLYYSGYLGLWSAVLLLWFSGSLYTTLRTHPGADGRLALVAFGGGVATSNGLAIAFSVMVVISSLAGEEAGIGPVEARLLNTLFTTTLVGVAGFSMAVFIAATAVISLRRSMFPKWFGWTSALIALGLLTPEGWIILALAMVWVAGVSVWLYRRGSSPRVPQPSSQGPA